MCAIVIYRRRTIRVITEDGTASDVRLAVVAHNGSFAELDDVASFHDVGEVEVYLRLRWGSLVRRFNLPASVLKGVAIYLEQYHQQGHMFFDCYAFANLVAGVEPHPCSEAYAFWVMTRRKKGLRRRAGDTIFLVEDTSEGRRFKHAAVYIGSGLYVSVYGAWGVLRFSTLRHMQESFGGNRILYATPRRTQSA